MTPHRLCGEDRRGLLVRFHITSIVLVRRRRLLALRLTLRLLGLSWGGFGSVLRTDGSSGSTAADRPAQLARPAPTYQQIRDFPVVRPWSRYWSRCDPPTACPACFPYTSANVIAPRRRPSAWGSRTTRSLRWILTFV